MLGSIGTASKRAACQQKNCFNKQKQGQITAIKGENYCKNHVLFNMNSFIHRPFRKFSTSFMQTLISLAPLRTGEKHMYTNLLHAFFYSTFMHKIGLFNP
jgi:hypothetical protein